MPHRSLWSACVRLILTVQGVACAVLVCEVAALGTSFLSPALAAATPVGRYTGVPQVNVRLEAVSHGPQHRAVIITFFSTPQPRADALRVLAPAWLPHGLLA